jgi:hypothetical protein
MKKFNYLRAITAAVWTGLLVFTAVFPSVAHAQGTAFSYQGRLNNGGTPTTGLYDFSFKVFGVAADGAALAGPIVFNGMAVTNGLFNVSLDFGPDIFTGGARWLEIAVRANGVGTLTVLTPRSSLLPTPYAIFAGKAGSVASGTVTATQLNTVGPAPTPGQFLSYDGGNLAWTAPGVAAGNIWSLNGSSAYYNAGNVGIGTSTPAHRLGIAGGPVWTSHGWIGAASLVSGSAIGWGANSAGNRFGLGFSSGGFGLFRTASDPGTAASPALYDFLIDNTGNVGLGTTFPQGKLHLYDAVNSVSHRIETGGSTNSWSRVEFKNPNGQWNMGTSRSFNNDEFYIQRNGLPISFALDAGAFSARFAVADFFLGHPTRRGAAGRALVDWVKPGTSVHQLVLNFANDWEETVIGGSVTEVKALRITGGADLAEPFQMKEDELEKGSVVVIDEEHPGRLKRSTSAYDKRVAGIISGANGINPGIALHQEGVLEGGQNVALSGRVYVQADATLGAIKPGDLLTTSDTPGHAMKVTDHINAQGAILGKAMSALKEGKGMVLVLVTLQ